MKVVNQLNVVKHAVLAQLKWLASFKHDQVY